MTSPPGLPAGVRLRLAGMVLLVLALAAAALLVMGGVSRQLERERQVDESRRHVLSRIATMDEGWRQAAFALARQVELWQGGEADAAVRDARLRLGLASALEQGDFAHAVLQGADGTELLRVGTRSQALPALPPGDAPLDWAWSEPDQTVYRAVDGGPLRIGTRTARLRLLVPLEPGVLARMVYPGNALELRREGRALARAGEVASAAGAGPARLGIRWDDRPGAPELQITRRLAQPFPQAALLASMAAAAGTLLLGGWFVLGRWVQTQALRVRQLQRATASFDAAGRAPQAAEAARQVAATRDDLGLLAEDLARMMQRIADSGEALRALNAGLEQRVAERTDELAAVNVELGRRAEQAEAATRAKSAFLANMSHEIRTPMNAILGLTHLLARDTRDTLQRERLAKIDNAARHLLQVINDILDLSKVEAGKVVLEQVEFGLDELMSRVFEIVGGPARDKGLELVLDTDHLPARLVGDPTRLAQVLINLLGNAVKFTEQGWVCLRGDLLADDAAGLHVRFEVRDTGIGIDPEQQARLFQPFEQGDGSTTRRHGGTGLGLALARHLVSLMGGEIGVDSVAGQGSCFRFTARLGRAAATAPPAAAPGLQGLRALLVDDLAEARAVLEERLQDLGLAVDAEAGGAAALARVQSALAAGRHYDVLLIDWRMPPPDGIQTLQSLRRLLGSGTPPAVLVTAFDLAAMWQDAHESRADAVLVKPITASALAETLGRVLRRTGLPMPDAAVAADDAPQRLRQRHAGQRVLLAEDNPVNAEVACELLHSVGLVVELAEDGRAAVDLALSRAYDLVLMDVQMPRLDGLQATRAIRERAGRSLPIVAMTANAFGEDRAACLEAGMNDHLAKPVDALTLYAALVRWLPLPAAAQAAPAAAMAAWGGTLPGRLHAVPGLDLDGLLRRAGGAQDLVHKVLAAWVRQYAEGVATLREAPPADAHAAWRATAHTVRGACAAAGLVVLEAQLQDFERDAAAGQDAALLAERARGLDDALRQTAAALRAAMSG